MVTVSYHRYFEKQVRKIKNEEMKQRIKIQIQKIIEDPEVGKPMRFGRKGTRELYISPFRLSYLYEREHDRVVLLSFYHKDEQ
ncbi:MAG: type II toxin-antitoxin system RelE/ParE family toxin [Thermoplasmata archaeon]|nr:type II toxin-antitoxin system RelE/ParE family toxin [Thermoplasmata archaeon]